MLDRFYFDIPEGCYVFRQIGDFSLWSCVSHDLLNGLTLADVLSLFNVVIDDDTQFCRIRRFDGVFLHVLEYRHYNDSKIILTIYHSKLI